MKKYPIKKIIWIIITVVVTVFIVQKTGHLLDPFEAEDGLNAIDAFHKLEDNSIEVLVFGSSRAWKGCDTSVINDEYGIKAYNYSCNWQAINTTLLFIRDSFRTQSPDVIFVETGHVGKVLEDTDLNGEIYYTRRIPLFDGKKEYLRECFGNNIERYASYYFPLIVFHDNWTQIDFENFYSPGKERYLEAYGYNEDCNTYLEKINIPPIEKTNQVKLPESSIKALDKIVKECEEKGTRLVFYTIPCKDGYAYSEAMKIFADSRSVDYINFYELLDDSGLSGNTDYQDGVHLNKEGARKVAMYLSEYIRHK